MKKSFIVMLIFASFAMKSFGFQSGDLLYTIISSEPPCVRLDGHINGHSAQGELIIPETVTHEDVVYTVTTIKENAFYMSHITSVVFPAGLTTIEAYAFESCQLTSLHIPATLTFIGGKMIWESFGPEEEQHFNPSRLRTQLLLAIATSIDALAIGISFACTGFTMLSQLTMPLLIIGIVSFLFSIVGYHLGRRFGRTITRRMKPELFGGVILVLIGVKILFSHLF